MGCRTGFYLLLIGDHSSEEILPLMKEMFEFIRDYQGEVPGASQRLRKLPGYESWHGKLPCQTLPWIRSSITLPRTVWFIRNKLSPGSPGSFRSATPGTGVLMPVFFFSSAAASKIPVEEPNKHSSHSRKDILLPAAPAF